MHKHKDSSYLCIDDMFVNSVFFCYLAMEYILFCTFSVLYHFQ